MAEKEYIERAKAQDGLDNIDWYHVNDNSQLLPGGKSDIETYVPFKAVEEMLKSIPAADVRPVVTCGKCKYGKYTGTEWFCDKHSGHADKFGEDASYHEYHSEHWFCADGEERTND